MDLVRLDPNDWTVFLMHLTNIEDILTSLHDVDDPRTCSLFCRVQTKESTLPASAQEVL